MSTNIARMASLLSDASRSAILVHLMDGRPHPATELANAAKIKPQTATFHLNKLLEAQIISVEKHGRHRYYKLANHELADSLETIFFITQPEPIQSFKQAKEMNEIEFARTCYDHLAGKLGVEIANALLRKEVLVKNETDFQVTKIGEKFFYGLDIDLEKLQTKRRAFSKCCLDWTERKHHIAGALGNILLERMLEMNWIIKVKHSRAIHITPLGRQKLKEVFSIKI
ncbi:TPA: winged helix-turn-helix domain-containing protein [Bacillus pacificus]|uniref:Helix-turn-helix domain protein n=1 Tax=Bacillus pacificus TaxID=2026187 RepID=A0A3P1BQ76_9BACI|nr:MULTISPECIES: winged helix-turn-helix domain-containing protein [Bacillus cereus group]AFQ12298.1 regulatory protein ArsR [Bacillus cereus FRI-35]KXX94693.1 ArsR family transcriptional regulator [Bacillus cereus]KXY88190.1 ArsR family transcriptional regulator [Bacillus cereus]MBL3794556.1 winged helix-turn-helix transcriptional regulator [Bacillus cereus]MBL3857863.1 winged helix-turn-helix transcriptional regulator [Bacillus cereus]